MLLIRRLIVAAAFPAALAAQSASVTIPKLPFPESAVRISVTLDMHFDVSAAALPAPIQMDVSSTAQYVRRTGPVDSLGGMSAELAFDTIATRITMNGTPMGQPLAGGGQQLTARYDSTGALVDLTVPPELERYATSIRQLQSSMLTTVPRGTMAVGDSLVTPFTAPVPFDIGMGASDSVALEGTMTHWLRAVEHDSGQVIAVFDQAMVAAINRDITMPALGTAKVSLRMTGGGTMKIDLQRGVVRSGSTDSRVDATMDLGAGGTMTMSGSIRTTSQGSPLP